jgi:hypothetical protein
MPGEYAQVSTGDLFCPPCVVSRSADAVRLLAHLPSLQHVVTENGGPVHYAFVESRPRCNIWHYFARPGAAALEFSAPHAPTGGGTPVGWLAVARARAQ